MSDSALPPPNPWTGLTDAVLSGWFNNQTGELFSGFPIGAADVVADIGCGLGGNARFCAKQGAQVMIVDIDPERIASAVAMMRAESPRARVEAHVSDCNPLPLPDAVASRVVCTEVIEHVADPALLMRELTRIGRPGARYLLTCPDPRSEALQQHVAPASYFAEPNHISILQHDDFAALVEAAGLTIEARHCYGFYWTMWLTLFWATDSALEQAGDGGFGELRHPVLDHWSRTWQALLDQPKGRAIKQALDTLLPKSQVIIARKGD